MTELALHILDLCQNSAASGAENLRLDIVRKGGLMDLSITDDGCGMDKEALRKCSDPFYTTRSTRRVGLGLPLMKACAQRCAGDLYIDSEKGRGTRLHAVFRYDMPDCPPMGDLVGTVQVLSLRDKPCLHFSYEGAEGHAKLDMEQIRMTLGGVSPSHPAVFAWIGEYLNEELKRADGAQALTVGEIYFGGAYTMKSIAELEAIRLATLEQVNLRREHADATHVVIAMGTCGIAAGAKGVLKAFMAEANKLGLLNLTIAQTGCMGYCSLEPMVEVTCPSAEKVLYTKVTPDMVERIVAEHIVGGAPVEDYIAK